MDTSNFGNQKGRSGIRYRSHMRAELHYRRFEHRENQNFAWGGKELPFTYKTAY